MFNIQFLIFTKDRNVEYKYPRGFKTAIRTRVTKYFEDIGCVMERGETIGVSFHCDVEKGSEDDCIILRVSSDNMQNLSKMVSLNMYGYKQVSQVAG